MDLDYWYLFECDYGYRVKEANFIKDVLREFDKDYATLVGVVVNNSPYCLEFSIAVNIQGDPVRFDDWLAIRYPEKLRRHNVFFGSMLTYNLQTFIDEHMVDLVLTAEGNHTFLWPEQELLERQKPQYKCVRREESKVFISHSSKDKKTIVNPLYSHLQANDIGVWLDSYEIDYGDNIHLKISEGIEKSSLGLFVLTDSFFDSESGWPMSEFSAYFSELMKSPKKVLMINAGVDPQKMDEVMKTIRCIDWNDGKALPEVAAVVKRFLKKESRGVASP